MKKYLMGMLLSSVYLVGCGRKSASITSVNDIFENDEQTRHLASHDEAVWTVFTGRETASTLSICTGSMLTEKYLLTASHCHPQRGDKFRSGSSIANGGGQDLQVIGIVEESTSYDYAIAEIRWLSGVAPADQKFIPGISTSASDLVTGRDGASTKLMTVGFPADKNLDFPRTMKPVPAYAEGYAKAYGNEKLYYNIGSINGNSGGAVLRADDHCLVSLTNGGAHNYGQGGWDHNDPEDRDAWNFGAAMHLAYTNSVILPQIFVNGVNVRVAADGSLKPAQAQ